MCLNHDFKIAIAGLLALACVCLVSGCGSPQSGDGMPWNTGSRTVDSLLDCAYRIETSGCFREKQLSDIIHALDSVTAGNKLWPMKAARALSRYHISQYIDSGAYASHHTDSISSLASLLSSSESCDYRYLSARMKLRSAISDENLEKKTNTLFGILPDFIDARDSMSVVETLYELDLSFGLVWDEATQVEYMHEILRYVPDSLPSLKGIIRSNIVRLERDNIDKRTYLGRLDSLRNEKELRRLAPTLGVMVFSDLYRLRGSEADLDTAADYMKILDIEHNAERVYYIQRLNHSLQKRDTESAGKYAEIIFNRIGDNDDPVDMESYKALIPYYNLIGDRESAFVMENRMTIARKSAEAYERALKMARMNADRRIGEFREYSETHERREREKYARLAVISILILIPSAMALTIWLRRRQRKKDEQLLNDLGITKRRLTVEHLKSAEKERAINSLLEDLDKMRAGNDHADPEALRRKLRLQLTGDDNWERFAAIFTDMRPGFIDRLKQKYPQLTQGDVRLCCLLDMELETKHIAQLLNIRPESVKKHRQRLRAKFGLTPDVKWPSFFSNF